MSGAVIAVADMRTAAESLDSTFEVLISDLEPQDIQRMLDETIRQGCNRYKYFVSPNQIQICERCIFCIF